MEHTRDMREWMGAIERKLSRTSRAVGNVPYVLVGDLREEMESNDNRQPTAPIEVTYQTALYLGTNSNREYARLLVDFPDVTKATDGTDIEVLRYELWGRDDTMNALEATTSALPGLAAPGVTFPGLAATAANKAKAAANVGPWVLLSESGDSSLRASDLIPGSVWSFRVRAIGVLQKKPGLWSPEFQVQLDEDTAPPPQPTPPKITVSMGTITVEWDGNGVTGAMPADFAYLNVAHAASTSPTNAVTRFYRGGGIHVLSGFPYYQPQFIRFQAVDESGNRSPWSEQGVGFTTPLVDEDVILSEIDAAKTHLKNVDAGVSILPNTVITEHLVVTEAMTAALAQFLHVKAGMIEANAVEADKLAAGSVTARTLEAQLALVSAIIAGDAMGTHAQMDPSGFRVFAADPADGIPKEVVRMGVAATDDYFAITKANSELAATISSLGVGSFAEVNARDSLSYRGRELEDLLAEFPRGQVTYGEYLGGAITGITTSAGYGIIEISWVAVPGRAYRLTGSVRGYMSGDNGQMNLQLIPTTNGVSPTLANSAWFVDGHDSSRDSWNRFRFDQLIHVNNTSPVTIRLLLASGRERGPGTWNILNGRIEVDDVGLVRNNSALTNTGGGTVSPPITTYVKTYQSNNSMNYTGSNAQYNYDTGHMYQGLSPAGYGNLKSIALFPDMTGDLAGANIEYIRVRFNFNHWYNNSGGTARIGVHGHSGIPGTYSQSGTIITSGGWPKPGARWLDIPPEHWASFKSGAYRGVSLEGDGTYQTYGIADRPTIEIRYWK